VSACLADTTCILSHKGLTHSLPLFCWTSFFHYHFLELASTTITLWKQVSSASRLSVVLTLSIICMYGRQSLNFMSMRI
jgi:hypothetical protein